MTPQEVAQKTLESIRKYPEQHDQGTWGDKSECGTSACVAGWAAIVTGNAEWKRDEYDPNVAYLRTITREPFDILGERLLGLDYEDAQTLFFRTRNDEAVRALEFLVDGKEIDWGAVYK